MIMTNTVANRDIVITDADFDRLTRLAESSSLRRTHHAFLRSLKDELDRGKVVSSTDVPPAVVTMNSKIVVRDTRTRETETWTLVYPEEADLDEGKLSVLAPLGTALLGAAMGQVVKFEAPAGLRRLKIEKILYQPEAAGDFHL